MRPLTEEETKTVFAKLASICGNSLKNLIAPLDNSPTADRYVFRVQKTVRLHDFPPMRSLQMTSTNVLGIALQTGVYYVLLSMANLATTVSRDNLLSLGTCLGKMTKTGKFKLHITALPILAEHSRYKIWIKPSGEMPFLYGGNIVKAHVGRWTEDTPEHTGIVVFSMDDRPLGFGVTARSTAEARRLAPTGMVVFRQADAGEYLRDEDSLFSSG
ncbi:60S ribosome subunit biogenesis protein NIP7 [Apiospora aurea]|uniref:60S ribosome subunit biogenesis protein NIP7 n=1 Tax=Apiospora aurea TaxID=335848 RepID=A0ABR1PV72_9PEZI